MKKTAFIAIALGLGIQPSPAYNLEGPVWNVGGITIVMNLNATQYRLTNARGFPLSDGSPTYQRVYWGVAADWNQYLLNLQIYPYPGRNPSGGALGNRINNISFGGSLGGSKLDINTLAVTRYSSDPNTNAFIEADSVFNEHIRWNSYRGPLYPRAMDIRRVMLHETGHMIGLDHPDTVGQQVNAIMNSIASNIDDLTNDDVIGAQSLYGVRAPAPPPQPYSGPVGIDPPPLPNAGPGEEIQLSFGSNTYWLIMPAAYDPRYSYPLICFLDAETNSATNVFLSSAFRSAHPCFAVIPQVPPTGGPNPGSWSNYTSNASETQWFFTWNGTLTPGGQFAVALIKAMIQQYPINPHRVYLTGVSDGAFGTSEVTCFDNTFISAALTVSGAGDNGPPDGNHNYAPNMVGVPFWAYHGSADPTVNVQMDINWINAIRRAGGTKAFLTIIQGGQHTIWDQVYQDPATFNWLFGQRSSGSGFGRE
jgi:predicted esterase